MSSSPRTSRSRKGSLKDAKEPHSVDFPLLIRESEERIKSFLKEEMKSITDRLNNIENNIFSVKMNCTRLDDEIVQIREVIKKQQVRIENHEEKLRENNLVVHNIPEKEVSIGIDILKTDNMKVAHLCEASRADLTTHDIVSIQRLGQQKNDRPRSLKITFTSRDKKFKLLNKKEISQC